MGPFSSIEDRRGVDVEESDDEPAKPKLYAIGLGATVATVLGGALIVIGSFLPLTEAHSVLIHVASNTIVQQGDWFVPVFGGVLALGAINSFASKRPSLAVVIVSLLAVVVVVLIAVDKSNRTLYVLNASGEREGNGEVVPFAIGIYVVGAGAVLALLGSVAMWRSDVETPVLPAAVRDDDRPTKQCPDCAETILEEARVCKHCGYRFSVLGSTP